MQNLLLDYKTVLEEVDSLGITQQDVIPEKFFQKSPEQVLENFKKYNEENPNATKVSIKHKLEQKKYSTPYQIYHDLQIASSQEILKYDVGTAEYEQVDYFFKFTVELLLREVGRLGLTLFQDHEEKGKDDPEDVLNVLRDDFDKISQSYSVSNGETIVYMNKVEEPPLPLYHSLYSAQPTSEPKIKTQPLFSSLIGKSMLDTRNTIVPDPYLLAKVVGTTKTVTSNSETLKSFGNPASRAAGPISGGRVLDSFFHPNWYTVEAPKWLNYRQRALKPPVESTLVKETFDNELRTFEKVSQTIRSFGPATDLRNSVLSAELRNAVWFNHFGAKMIEQIKRSSTNSNEPEVPSVPLQKDEDAMDEDKVEEEQVHLEANGKDSSRHSNNIDHDQETIKIENLVHYRPEDVAAVNELKTEIEELRGSPAKIQKHISSSLLRLNKLRQERFSSQVGSKKDSPSVAEVVLYKKILRLFTILLKSNAGQDQTFAHEVSKKLPILMNEIPGVLPGHMPSTASSLSKTGRLASIRGPYKKKRGFM